MTKMRRGTFVSQLRQEERSSKSIQYETITHFFAMMDGFCSSKGRLSVKSCGFSCS